MEKIPQTRLLLYFIIALFLPLIGITFYYSSKKTQYDLLLARLASDIELAVKKSIIKAPNREVRRRYLGKDPCYTNKRLEPMRLLQKEQELVRKLSLLDYHPQADALRRRGEFLNQNSLTFSEAWVKKYTGFSETQEGLNHSVEVDTDDLFTLLAAIEDDAQDKPQMFISECKLERKKGLLQEAYLMQLKIIKREFFR